MLELCFALRTAVADPEILEVDLRQCHYGPNSTLLDSTRLDTFDSVEPCFSNMADDEEAVVLACTSLVFCTLSVHVNKTEKKTTRCVGERLSNELVNNFASE